MSNSPPSVRIGGRRQITAWALWDFGATGLNAMVVTFVFSVYLTSAVGDDLPGSASPASWLGWALGIAGVVVAVLAPVTGVWVDAPWRRRRVLAVLTVAAVALTAAMSLIRDDYHYLVPGLVLLAAAVACNELATVPYNAMLRQLSTPQTSGQISGMGLGLGYLGSVALLLIAYFGFIAGDGDTRGLLGLPAADGQNVRAAMLLTAAWFAVFALPVLFAVPSAPRDAEPRAATGVLGAFFGGYRVLWTEIVSEWRRDHNVVYYLIASAIFRDGLTGIFAFGAVLGVNVYGISGADVLLFGVCASTVAALGALLGGLLDDRFGPKPVIVASLTALIATALTLMALDGPLAFWVCGLTLCLFIGPTLSAARTLMLRMSAEGKEGVAFGLYTTTGRAVSYVAPMLFSLFIAIFGTDRAGMGGLVAVLAAGLVAMLLVRVPARR
ncbi:MFS transporter [Mycolicibacterium phlei]|uniref:MFS transporter n=1 Tax=Mycolicibacterium phlei TaxID=1771 RepID=UPI00025AE754|nr:MFS transporter [Mycolicibacterium phlei]EID10408.1 major facilitator superfamily permease [Mycolicibacterium phlei RIVM601174]MBF4192666.1 major facilitator superfamily permease [Mycolicibacterium phlei]